MIIHDAGCPPCLLRLNMLSLLSTSFFFFFLMHSLYLLFFLVDWLLFLQLVHLSFGAIMSRFSLLKPVDDCQCSPGFRSEFLPSPQGLANKSPPLSSYLNVLSWELVHLHLLTLRFLDALDSSFYARFRWLSVLWS